jgi:aromatic-L-amino-acid decarboxylase
MGTATATDLRTLLHAAADHAAAHLEADADAPVRAPRTAADLIQAFEAPLPEDGADAAAVLEELVATAAPGITRMTSPRFFGFVVGGSLPAALAADWMAAAWDNNAGLAEPTPAVAAAEQVAGEWLKQLLGLPSAASFALVTGCQMAHATALAAARHRVLADAGWDVERDGLAGAPRIRVLAGAERHVTVDRALRLLGLGTACVEPVEVDARGAMRADALAAALRAGGGAGGPLIVCAQAGNVNTGAVDPLRAIIEIARKHGAWTHVDGAFGLWANAAPERRALLDGVEDADSWATDGHKWLNVPYDCGMAFVADAAAHRAAMTVTAAYLVQHEGGPREPVDFTPEFSRGRAVWRSGPRCARWAARASRRWSSGRARAPSASPPRWRPSPASRSSPRSSTRCWSARQRATPPPTRS